MFLISVYCFLLFYSIFVLFDLFNHTHDIETNNKKTKKSV